MVKEPWGQVLSAAVLPVCAVALLAAVKAVEELAGVRFGDFGVLPRSVEGLPGILLFPFIHGDWPHLFNNAVTLLVLGTMMLYFYRPVAVPAILWMYAISGLWLWVGGRAVYHIGASGMVYALFGFLFLSGILRRHLKLMALSMLVVFLYGGMVWGIFPTKEGISWEGHLYGLLAGMAVALAYRRHGPQRTAYSWESAEDGEEELPDWYRQEMEQGGVRVTYHFKEKKDESQAEEGD